ncbi:MAG: HAD-IIB family hydrolase [Bacillota bacterium]|nr:HAD-IIB family hydrolase [Bacillota bacterium]
MPNRKLIVTDLDGTLLTAVSCLLLPESELIIKQLAKAGHQIILTSGRAYRTMLPYYQKLELSTPMISYNGAMISNPGDPAFPAYSSTFDKEFVKSYFSAVKEKVNAFIGESDTHYYRYKGSDYLENFFPSKDTDLIDGPLDETLRDSLYSCVMGADDEYSDFLKSEAEKAPGIGWRHWSGSPYSELYKLDSDKAKGLAYIMRYLGFKKEDVIALGDSDNDYEAMKLAGTAYCMKGCKSDLLKANFPQTEFDCHHNGAAIELLKLLGE